MKRLLFAILPLCVVSTANADDFLTGNTKLACEAILCLSTGNRPSECSPSIHKYFSINHKKISDTIKARRNFLNLCPTVSEDKQMASLVDAIANGAGRCDVESLNKNLLSKKRRLGSYINWNNPQLPSYCQAYYNHSYTDSVKPKWQCTKTVKEAKLVYGNSRFEKARIEQVERCVAGKWVL